MHSVQYHGSFKTPKIGKALLLTQAGDKQKIKYLTKQWLSKRNELFLQIDKEHFEELLKMKYWTKQEHFEADVSIV